MMLRVARGLVTLSCGGGSRARLSILIYHRVRAKRDPLMPSDIDTETFTWQMRLVSRLFSPLVLSEAVDRLVSNSLPPRALCVTFDDGYADNHERALPILLRYGVPATFFVATGFLDGGRMWNDTVIEGVRKAREGVLDLTSLGLEKYSIDGSSSRAGAAQAIIGRLKYLHPVERQARVDEFAGQMGELPRDLMMSTDQVRELSEQGMQVGAHTVTHPILSQIGESDARDEIMGGKRTLEEIIGRRVTCFAYPNGRPGRDYGSREVDLVHEAGFRAAVTTGWGVARSGSDVYQLPRFTPWDTAPGRFLLRLGYNCLGGYDDR